MRAFFDTNYFSMKKNDINDNQTLKTIDHQHFLVGLKLVFFPILIRFLRKLVKLKLKTILKSDYEQCAFATRLHAYDDHQQQAVSKFKLREKERQHSHGNFGRMLGGFYNFFFSKLVDRMLGILCMLYCRVVLQLCYIEASSSAQTRQITMG